MVVVLHRDAELTQREHHVAAEVRRHVERGQVEVAALVQHLGALVVLEQEELELRPQVEVVGTPCPGRVPGRAASRTADRPRTG